MIEQLIPGFPLVLGSDVAFSAKALPWPVWLNRLEHHPCKPKGVVGLIPSQGAYENATNLCFFFSLFPSVPLPPSLPSSLSKKQ